MSWEFGLLGPVEVVWDGVVVPIPATKQRIVLATLLLDAGRVVPLDALVDRLWDEDPPGGARNTLQNHVLRLRRALGGAAGPGPVRTHPRGYAIEVADGELDLRRFDLLMRRAKSALSVHDAEGASALLAEALGLWRGRPLSDVPSAALQRDVVPALLERRLVALELRVGADLVLGRHTELLPELAELTCSHPLQEPFWAQRMLALHRAGRQGEALHCYRTVRALLAEELGVDPGAELRELHRRMLADDPALAWSGTGARAATVRDEAPAASPLSERGGGLPAETTSFVGRGRERIEAGRLLDVARLVTLTGVGGVGKTRLALRVAADAAGSCPDGVWTVDLAPLTDPRLLDRAVCEALGFQDQSALPGREVLVRRLRDMRTLLVLDNCEHVVTAVADLVHTLLRAAPGLRVLATSRHLLHVQGEHVLPLAPLPPDEALRLLSDRAAASAPGVRVAEAGGGAARQLCRRLDGIPLAIELAAIRLATFSAEEILERLDDRFQFLADTDTGTRGAPGAPHTPASRYVRTLRGVVDWSHDLCTEPEQVLWARLSVFSGDFGLEAAETVCSGDGIDREQLVRLLSGLVDKSILSMGSRERRTRYRLLETIRQYGGRRLRALGQETVLRRRHLDYYRTMAATTAAQWCSPLEVDWLTALRRELPNIRAALDFSATQPGEAGAGLEITVNLTRTRFWFFSSTLGEGRHWFERTLAPVLPAAVADPALVGAMTLRAWVAMCQGEQDTARTYLTACHRLAGRIPGSEPLPSVLFIQGADAILIRGCPTSIALFDRARRRMREAGLTGDAHMATMLWAMACTFFGERDAAFEACEEYVADGRARGGSWACSWTRWVHGLTELLHGDPYDAVRLIRESLVPQWDIDDRWGPVWGVESLAWAAEATDEPDYAAQLLGAAAQLRRTTGVALDGLVPLHDVHARTVMRVRRALGENAYVAAFARGTVAGAADVPGLVLRQRVPDRQG
ncbi:BTAD domain-containing putative transcriptional regulator [Streptomyces sp. NPDC046925]|uniref:BTAD domain-containing putative transcriptional regulator n=1 Tax=Streptomyces sp. NPDC046925 TaxID=3155375 RepID=UPI0033FE4870